MAFDLWRPSRSPSWRSLSCRSFQRWRLSGTMRREACSDGDDAARHRCRRLLALGSIVTTISVYGVLRMLDVYSQLHFAGMASGVGAIAILLASIATSDVGTITDAVLVIAFLLLTAPISSHAIAWATYRRRGSQTTRSEI
jgi:monovalent cation/proton antiporter MnhG/PhaG subunit